MKNLARSLAAGALALGALTLAGAPAQAADDASVSVLHGIPDAVVDVYANGDELLTDFEPGTLTDPVMLPADDYDLKVVAAGDGPDGKAVVEAKGVTVPAGANITVVAHLSEDGKPTLTPFVNDTSEIAAGNTRLTVRHTAAAPAVDVRAGGDPVFEGLTNPNEATADIAAGTVTADVVLAGTEDVAIGPADLDLAEGVSTIVYAWGSAADGNLELAVQTISGMHSSPHGVPGGTGGQAADGGLQSGWVIGLGGVAAALMAFAVTGRVRRTHKV
jgi:Domain of unknown function (DUF4397)